MSGMDNWPDNLDGRWEKDGPKMSDDYQHYRAGPVEVRYNDDFEPDGELVTHKPVRVHIERMNENSWWIGLSWGKTGHVAIDFHSKKPIKVMWRDERG